MAKETIKSGKYFATNKFFVYLFLTVGAIVSLFPFYYMFVMATRLNREINQVPPPSLL